MTIIIKPSTEADKIEKSIATLKRKGKFDAHKYCGTIKLKKSPIDIQKQMRNEWA